MSIEHEFAPSTGVFHVASSNEDAQPGAVRNAALKRYGRNLFYASLWIGLQALVAWGALHLLRAGYYGVRTSADEAGFVQHRQVTSVVLTSAWMIGEIRGCTAIPDPFIGEISTLNCADDSESDWQQRSTHALPVTYWGRVVRPDHVDPLFPFGRSEIADWEWRCQRKDASVKCWAVN